MHHSYYNNRFLFIQENFLPDLHIPQGVPDDYLSYQGFNALYEGLTNGQKDSDFPLKTSGIFAGKLLPKDSKLVTSVILGEGCKFSIALLMSFVEVWRITPDGRFFFTYMMADHLFSREALIGEGDRKSLPFLTNETGYAEVSIGQKFVNAVNSSYEADNSTPVWSEVDKETVKGHVLADFEQFFTDIKKLDGHVKPVLEVNEFSLVL